jgi:hypothetical protein
MRSFVPTGIGPALRCTLPTALAALLSTVTAAAQLPSVDVRTFRPSTDPRAGLVTEPVTTPGHLAWNVGLDTHYSYEPVVLSYAGSSNVAVRPLRYGVLGADLVAGLGLGSRMALGFALPVVLAQAGDGSLPPMLVSTGAVPRTAIGDVALSAKAAIVKNDDGGFGLAALVGMTMPTGDRTSFAAEGAVTGHARVIAEYSLMGIIRAQASLGYFFRTERRAWPYYAPGSPRESSITPVCVASDDGQGNVAYRSCTTFGDQVPWTLGFTVRPGVIRALDPGDRQTWEIGLRGWVPVGPVAPFVDKGAAALSPVLLSTSDRIALGHDKDAYLLAGMDFGLTTAVGDPPFRVILGVGWAPRNHDKDGDGIADDLDSCPDIPEDKDGFEDSDGCPEVDNDEDGVIDREDACPTKKGARSKDPRTNGCPSPDRDGDGLADDVDSCPDKAGPRNHDRRLDGCPLDDGDSDGVPDALDRCPTQPEDHDAFEDLDGCPDPDNDGDGVQDKDDACPMVAGEPSPDRSRSGCPNLDRDGDTFQNDKDECPDAAETFNGIKDDDGCPDEGGKPLVTIDAKLAVRLAAAIKFVGTNAAEIDPASLPLLRALALELNKHRDWYVLVGVKPTKGESAAMLQGIAVTSTLAGFVQRDVAAETMSWDVVLKRGAAADAPVGFVVVAPKDTKPADAKPADGKPADAKPEPKKDTKPEPKKDAKPEPKKDTKPKP